MAFDQVVVERLPVAEHFEVTSRLMHFENAECPTGIALVVAADDFFEGQRQVGNKVLFVLEADVWKNLLQLRNVHFGEWVGNEPDTNQIGGQSIYIMVQGVPIAAREQRIAPHSI